MPIQATTGEVTFGGTSTRAICPPCPPRLESAYAIGQRAQLSRFDRMDNLVSLKIFLRFGRLESKPAALPVCVDHAVHHSQV